MGDRIPVTVADLAGALEHMDVAVNTQQGIFHGTLHWPTAVATDVLKAISDAGPDEPPKPAFDASADPEVQAITVIVAALASLDDMASARVMHYLCERHGIEYQP